MYLYFSKDRLSSVVPECKLERTRSEIAEGGETSPPDDGPADAEECGGNGIGKPGKAGLNKFRFESIGDPGPIPAAFMAARDGRPAGT